MTKSTASPESDREFKAKSDWAFYTCFFLIGGFYIVMIVAMLVAESTYTTPGEFFSFLVRPEVRYSLRLSLLSCAISTILSLWVAVPIGYLMSRYQFWGKSFVDAVLDIPIVLPPLVVGLCLLILFSSSVVLGVESFIHSIEQTIGNYLVPIVWLAAVSLILASLLYTLRQRTTTVHCAIAATTGLFIVGLFNWPYFVPSLPGWLPISDKLTTESLTYCDQGIFSTSSEVYRAKYSFRGTAQKAKSVWTALQATNETVNFTISDKTGIDGRPTGEFKASAVIGRDKEQSGSALVINAVPQKDEVRIASLQGELDELDPKIAELSRLFPSDRTQANVRSELQEVRTALDALRSNWDSRQLDEQLPSIERALDRVRAAMIPIQGEVDDLHHEIDTLKQLDKDGRDPAELQQLLSDLQQQASTVSTKLTAAKDAYKTKPTTWSISLSVRRADDEFVPNWTPKLTIPVTYEIPSVILAQFMVACAFAVRTMRVTFDQIHRRYEQVALTLGCNHGQAFWLVVFPQCRRGLLAAGTLAWARSLGEFGPILIFSGATRLRTEVLPTTVFLEFSTGHLQGAVSASLIIIAAAMIVLVFARILGLKRMAI